MSLSGREIIFFQACLIFRMITLSEFSLWSESWVLVKHLFLFIKCEVCFSLTGVKFFFLLLHSWRLTTEWRMTNQKVPVMRVMCHQIYQGSLSWDLCHQTLVKVLHSLSLFFIQDKYFLLLELLKIKVCFVCSMSTVDTLFQIFCDCAELNPEPIEG